MGTKTVQPTEGQQPGQSPQMPPEGNGTQDAPPSQDTPQSFEDWLKDQPDAIKSLYGTHTSGLRSALQKERDDNKALTKQLKELGGKLEEGSEARKAIDDITQKLEVESSRADFYEEAAGKGVADLKLAWLAIQAEEDLSHRGKVDFDALKERHPQLFTQQPPIPRGNAGSGAGQHPGGGSDMNTLIRKAAGRQ